MTANLKLPLFKFIVRAFVAEHGCKIASVAILCLLYVYTFTFYPEKLFEFLVIIIMWLQLELAYRQWWLEANRRKPDLIFDFAELRDAKIVMYIKNIGNAPAYSIEAVTITVRRSMLEKYRLLISSKEQLIEQVPQRWCVVFGREVRVPPGRREYIEIDLEELKRCMQEEDELALFRICYEDPHLNPKACTEIIEIESFGDFCIHRSHRLKEDLPGLLTKLPDVFKDAYKYYKAYKISVKYLTKRRSSAS